MSVILKLENINKSFPGVKALQNMHIELEEGELHAVCGENGAGKSTLMKVIIGVHKPDSGKVYLRGEEVVIKEPNDAYNKGIAIIFQETSLFEDLTVLENLFVGHEPINRVWGIDYISYKAMHSIAKEIFNFLGMDIPLDKKISQLGVADKQMVEIAKALTYGAKVLILDEPTAALTSKEVKALFQTIDYLKSMGISMLYISHRMEEIFEKADRVTVIRDGSFIHTSPTSNITEKQLISLMVGRELDSLYPPHMSGVEEVVLKVDNLSKKGVLSGISFELKRGEILGVGGLAGSGRTELAECLCGLMGYNVGSIFYEGKEFKPKNYRNAISRGLVYVSEDRKKYGLIVNMAIQENLTLSYLYQITHSGFIPFKKEAAIVDEYIHKFQIKTPSRDFLVDNLSGGNQQKVLVAKALVTKPKVLVLDEPTRGVDVGAKAEIHKLIADLTNNGISVIMISSEMPELIGMSDRIMVLKDGKKIGELKKGEFTQEKILDMAL